MCPFVSIASIWLVSDFLLAVYRVTSLASLLDELLIAQRRRTFRNPTCFLLDSLLLTIVSYRFSIAVGCTNCDAKRRRSFRYSDSILSYRTAISMADLFFLYVSLFRDSYSGHRLPMFVAQLYVGTLRPIQDRLSVCGVIWLPIWDKIGFYRLVCVNRLYCILAGWTCFHSLIVRKTCFYSLGQLWQRCHYFKSCIDFFWCG